MWRELQAMLDAYGQQAGRQHYHYPDDVVTETDADGNCSARLAMSVTFATDRPCIFAPGELAALRHAYTLVWERARERYRDKEREEFLSRHPTIVRERQAWQEFLTMKGVKPDENLYEKGITSTCGEYVQWREFWLRELAAQAPAEKLRRL